MVKPALSSVTRRALGQQFFADFANPPGHNQYQNPCGDTSQSSTFEVFNGYLSTSQLLPIDSLGAIQRIVNP